MRPKCLICDLDMELAFHVFNFPKGILQGKMYKYPKCGNGLIPFDEAKILQQKAEKLGFYYKDSKER